MSKPLIHAKDSVKKYGGKIDDYIEIHNWFDSSKAFVGSNLHRALYHHTAGIFLAEKIFGVYITNSDGKEVSVRDIGEDHVSSDFNGFIPTPQDYLDNMEIKDWMINGKGAPPPHAQIIKYRNKKEPTLPFLPYDDGKGLHEVINISKLPKREPLYEAPPPNWLGPEQID